MLLKSYSIITVQKYQHRTKNKTKRNRQTTFRKNNFMYLIKKCNTDFQNLPLKIISLQHLNCELVNCQVNLQTQNNQEQVIIVERVFYQLYKIFIILWQIISKSYKDSFQWERKIPKNLVIKKDFIDNQITLFRSLLTKIQTLFLSNVIDPLFIANQIVIQLIKFIFQQSVYVNNLWFLMPIIRFFVEIIMKLLLVYWL